jgi:hypothetical protein
MFEEAIIEGDYFLCKSLLRTEIIDITSINHGLIAASKKGFFKLANVLVVNGKADPSFQNNYAIKALYEHYLENKEPACKDFIVFLWKDKRVKNSFKNDNHDLFLLLQAEDTQKKLLSF